MPLIFEELPITKAAADATHFVSEADNSAGGNLTGVGAGLSGADLVFTQTGTVDAASAGWTSIAANKGFTVTNTFIDTFMRNATGFSMLWHLKNTTAAASATTAILVYMAGTSPANWQNFASGITTQAQLITQMIGKFGTNLVCQSATPADILPASSEFYVLESNDYTNDLSFVGISVGATQPTKLTDFVVYAVSTAAQTVPASAVSCTADTNYVLGYSTGGAAFSFKSFTAKLGPSVTLA